MKVQLEGSSLSNQRGTVLPVNEGLTSGPLTSKLDQTLLADDCAMQVGSQTAVFSFMFGFNWAADDQVPSN